MSYEIRNHHSESQRNVISVFADTAEDRKTPRRRSNSSRNVKLVFREQGNHDYSGVNSIRVAHFDYHHLTNWWWCCWSWWIIESSKKTPIKLKEWLKNKLKALDKLLGRIAGETASALPGIIISIIAGVLNFLKKIFTAAAGNV